MDINTNTLSAKPHQFITRSLTIAVIAGLLAACGGGGSDSPSSPTPTDPKPPESNNDPQLTTPPPVNEDKNDGNTPVVVDPKPSTPPSESHGLNTSELEVFNRLNQRRESCGFGGLNANDELKKSADNHANYLLYMNKNSTAAFQGHYETPVDDYSGIKNPYYSGYQVKDRVQATNNMGTKAQAVNYNYQVLAENLSALSFNQAYVDVYDDKQIALKGINGLLAAPYHMASLLSPSFMEVGISYGRDTLKKPLTSTDGSSMLGYGSVLELVLATPYGKVTKAPTTVLNYPCNDLVGTQYELTHESPNPFGENGRDLAKNPIGQPIYILGQAPISVTNYKMTDAAGNNVELKALTQQNDPNKLLLDNQVILLPLKALKPSQLYQVTYTVSQSGGTPETKSFSFMTKAAD